MAQFLQGQILINFKETKKVKEDYRYFITTKIELKSKKKSILTIRIYKIKIKPNQINNKIIL